MRILCCIFVSCLLTLLLVPFLVYLASKHPPVHPNQTARQPNRTEMGGVRGLPVGDAENKQNPIKVGGATDAEKRFPLGDEENGPNRTEMGGATDAEKRFPLGDEENEQNRTEMGGATDAEKRFPLGGEENEQSLTKVGGATDAEKRYPLGGVVNEMNVTTSTVIPVATVPPVTKEDEGMELIEGSVDSGAVDVKDSEEKRKNQDFEVIGEKKKMENQGEIIEEEEEEVVVKKKKNKKSD
ncbi:hypothetical protein GCK72_003198 [Caenorhabditis remanei]|uniref:Uncharacterized protein n=1 Tax=Caenorhabditis remanei TaxID=31234 RepID=A0A6A5HYL4_CAERE|nr:hypothetical protein GCK72_003198 [Caenorhabditis remanei]KAF1771372.1 hypothetical protein GCK72_003198 [Caenorhabditis remanei]